LNEVSEKVIEKILKSEEAKDKDKREGIKKLVF
jgi:hypothetical protein